MLFKTHEKTEKSYEDDYATTVFLNYVKNNVQIGDIFQPSYFKDELNINDIKSLINKLLKQKYIEKGKEGTYHILPKSKNLLLEKADYMDFFNLATPYVSISEYKNAKTYSKDKESFQGIMISILLRKIDELKKKDDYVAVKNIHMDIAILYEQLSYEPQAMYHYLTALYYEVSGLEYYDKFLQYIDGECTAKDLENYYDYTCIEPQIIYSIKRLKEIYIDEMVDTVYEKNAININLCRIDKFKELVCAITNDSFANREWQIYFWRAFKGLISAADIYKSNIKNNG